MRKPSEHEIEKLFKAIIALDTIEECSLFLRDLLTRSEIDEAAIRWKVANMLHEGKTYVQIEEDTGLSSTTIARVHKWLKEGRGGYLEMVNKLAKSG